MYINSKYASNILTSTMESYLKTESIDDILWNQGQDYLDVVSDSRGMGNWREIFNYDYKY